MDWSSVKPWIAKLAPFLGAAIGGPFGSAAGALIGDALGVKDASPESIASAIKTGTLSADHIVALKKAEQEFALKMQEAGFKQDKDLEELAYKDRDSARQREISVKDWTPRVLAYGVTIGFFLLLYWMMKRDVPAANKDVMNIMLGSLGSAWISVVQYYFGSSAGSARKDELAQLRK